MTAPMSGPTEPDPDVDGPAGPAGPTREELARSFDATAAAYELGRPEYPDVALTFWDDRGAFERDAAVLDLAAGTGKLTRLLPLVCQLHAVEPLPQMRAEFAGAIDDIDVVEVLDAYPSFGAVETFECRWEHDTTVEAVLADVLSRSYVSALPIDERLAVLTRTREAIERHLGTGVERVRYPYRTTAFWAPLATET